MRPICATCSLQAARWQRRLHPCPEKAGSLSPGRTIAALATTCSTSPWRTGERTAEGRICVYAPAPSCTPWDGPRTPKISSELLYASLAVGISGQHAACTELNSLGHRQRGSGNLRHLVQSAAAYVFSRCFRWHHMVPNRRCGLSLQPCQQHCQAAVLTCLAALTRLLLHVSPGCACWSAGDPSQPASSRQGMRAHPQQQQQLRSAAHPSAARCLLRHRSHVQPATVAGACLQTTPQLVLHAPQWQHLPSPRPCLCPLA